MTARAFTLLALLATAFAGNLQILNFCDQEVYYKVDDPGVTGTPNPIPGWVDTAAAPVPIVLPLAGEGNAVKFDTDKDVAKPVLFDYSIKDVTIYYDVSDVDGLPVEISATPSDEKCDTVTCPALDGSGSFCRSTRACGKDVDVQVSINCGNFLPTSSIIKSSRIMKGSKIMNGKH